MQKRGFTALEMLISLAIMALVASLIMSSMINYRKNRSLENAADQIEAYLQQARSRTISSEYQSSYGVHFSSSGIVMYKGSYATSQENKQIAFDSYVEISTISINGGGSDVYFHRLTGVATTTATIVVRLKDDPTKQKTIQVNSAGIVSR